MIHINFINKISMSSIFLKNLIFKMKSKQKFSISNWFFNFNEKRMRSKHFLSFYVNEILSFIILTSHKTRVLFFSITIKFQGCELMWPPKKWKRKMHRSINFHVLKNQWNLVEILLMGQGWSTKKLRIFIHVLAELERF